MNDWLTDIRYAARRLVARPAYSILAVLTLSLGIGGTAAVFGIARPLLVDALPYGNTASVGALWMPGWWTEEEFLYMRGKFTGFRSVAAYRPRDMTIRDAGAPARLIPGVQTSWELFDVLGARPMLGRTFQLGDDATGADPAVVISYGLWRELGGDASVVGKRLTLDGTPRTVIGVMPRGFWFPSPDVRIWHAEPLDPIGRNGSYALAGLAASGTDIRHLESQTAAITRTLGERFHYSAKADKTRDATITPLRESLVGPMRPALIATSVAMALILLIACTNVAALMLGQTEARATELAVRSALGATRGRIVQQLLFETLLIGIIAAGAGALLAAGGFHVLAIALPLGAWSETASFDWTMFAAALGVALTAVFLVAAFPAVLFWRSDLRDMLNRGRTGGVTGGGARIEQSLIILEVALAMLIATGTGLLVRSVVNRYAIRPGFETRGIAVADVIASADVTQAQRRRALDDIEAALSTLPGVKSAAAAMRIPLRGNSNSFNITVEGHEDREASFTFFRIVTPRYFETMGIPLRAGRLFDAADRPDSAEMPVIINEALAKKYFPGENPIGKRLGGGFNTPQRIIGIVANVAEGNLTSDPEPARYYSGEVAPWFGSNASLVVRTTRPQDAAAVLDEVRRTIQRVAPNYAVEATTTGDRVLAEAIGPVRQVMSLLALLSALALLLGGVGIYGVISHFATRRKRDWAIRVALGLTGAGVVTHIVRHGATLALIGIGCGAIGALALTRLLASFLFGVTAIDPVAFAGASVTLMLIGIAAALAPAWRAGRVDPSTVLREH